MQKARRFVVSYPKSKSNEIRRGNSNTPSSRRVGGYLYIYIQGLRFVGVKFEASREDAFEDAFREDAFRAEDAFLAEDAFRAEDAFQ